MTLKDKVKTNAAVDTLDVVDSVNDQDLKENISSYAEWLVVSASHDAFYTLHPQGWLYKRDMNAVQFLYVIAGSDREKITTMMNELRKAPAGTNVMHGGLKTFIFVVDFSDPQNSDFGLFLKEQLDENMRARVLTEFIIVDFHRSVYFKVGGGKVQDKSLKKLLDSTSVAIKMDKEKRKEWTNIKRSSVRTNLNDLRTKKGKFGLIIPMIAIIAINVTIFVIDLLFWIIADVKPIENFGAQYNELVWQGEWWRMIASTFLHADFSHIAGNMVMLVLTSRILRGFYSKFQYCLIYMVAGFIGSLLTFLCMDISIMSLGASGAIMGIGGVLCYRMFLGKNSKYFRRTANCITIIAIVGYNLVVGLTMPDINNWAHFGGFITGFAMAWLIELIQKRKEKNNAKESA